MPTRSCAPSMLKPRSYHSKDSSSSSVSFQRSSPQLMALSMSGLRSEEHTSELQSRLHLVCRLLLEKKKKKLNNYELNELLEQQPSTLDGDRVQNFDQVARNCCYSKIVIHTGLCPCESVRASAMQAS